MLSTTNINPDWRALLLLSTMAGLALSAAVAFAS